MSDSIRHGNAIRIVNSNSISTSGAIMTNKLFLYSNDAANADTLRMFRNKGYDAVALTSDPAFFWQQIDKVASGGYLTIMSHGDSNGFLMVEGTSGKDMTDAEITSFGGKLKTANVTLYLLSCHTGSDPFCAKLTKTSCKFAAPKGYALANGTSQSLSVLSVTDPKASPLTYPGWGGDPALYPNRPNKALDIK
ncbi:hypothetical protein [Burkholderia perseverans]|uniref:hypothetical protein n=1 Tax=Burkholderia perseverans TaxID=2615214 RepID=UPI001FEE709A|nr:hypothetical protein [Burkholderia perseverans]